MPRADRQLKTALSARGKKIGRPRKVIRADANQRAENVAAEPPAGKSVAKLDNPNNPEFVNRIAPAVLLPSINASAVVNAYASTVGGSAFGSAGPGTGYGPLLDAMFPMDQPGPGDMKRAEAMLFAQAHGLQAIFTNLSVRAQKQESITNMDTFLRMAMKAQNQCRMTLETLATIKNPPVVFARQANINNGGQQQVNNGAGGQADGAFPNSHAVNSEPERNQLLEASDGQRLDTGAAGAASGVDPQLETVGAVDWPANPRRKGASRSAR